MDECREKEEKQLTRDFVFVSGNATSIFSCCYSGDSTGKRGGSKQCPP
jgi:hypothetical protein